MKTIKKKVSFYLATSINLAIATSANAAQPMPASMEEMWKIIQQQQKEIETLKAKSAQSETLQQEVSTLKEAQKEQSRAIQQANPAPQTAANTVNTVNTPAKGELERKTDVLATEVEKLKTQLFIPESREYKSQYGLGPAASNVYRVNRGLSIGGYGEAMYTNYAEAAHDIMPFIWKNSSQYLAPFFRVERYNTLAAVAKYPDSGEKPDPSTGLDRWIYQAGLSYKPIDNIVIKADYRNIQDRKLVPADVPFGDEFNLGVGFIY